MSALADLQRGFTGDVRGFPTNTNLGIVEAGLAADRRLAIYRNHHRISLTGALAANFPTVAALLGPQVFDGVAADFVAASPPAEPCLSAYGNGFAAYLDAEPRLSAVPYIGDVARLDWAMNKAERADDIPVFGAGDLERLGDHGLAELRLSAHPSLSLLHSRYPLTKIRDVANGVGEGVSLDGGASLLIIWRRSIAVDCAELDTAEYQFITAMSVGEPLAVAARDLPPERLADLLARFVLTGAFAAPGL